jgi:hypothetical protein
MADIITTIEQAIIDRLRERIPEILVESFPDEPETYQLQHHLGGGGSQDCLGHFQGDLSTG